MATRTLRNPAGVARRALKPWTAWHHRPMDAAASATPSGTVPSEGDFVSEWLESPDEFRADLDQPERSTPREVDIA